ncbi:hypothetical protein [Paraburkholderia terrae]|uniref:hypothetical protein n=1 Tax=Paraburkholderia terrae TaxID=311230 RepID=UPI0020454AE8|nr:hypothetical protein [Paraburkholderia terrae]BDC45424.1 hypothetical protein PTKU15_87210 [Paraburkholderia terrae]
MNQKTPGYAVGRWESLWPCEPYMAHEVLLGLDNRRVVAARDRVRKQWQPMSASDVEYLQQILDETFPDIFDVPHEYGFEYVETVPPSFSARRA